MSPREILLEGALFHRRFSAKNLVMIGVIHVVVLSVAYFAYDYTAYVSMKFWCTWVTLHSLDALFIVEINRLTLAATVCRFLDANDSIGEPNDLLVVDTADVTVPAT